MCLGISFEVVVLTTTKHATESAEPSTSMRSD